MYCVVDSLPSELVEYIRFAETNKGTEVHNILQINTILIRMSANIITATIKQSSLLTPMKQDFLLQDEASVWLVGNMASY